MNEQFYEVQRSNTAQKYHDNVRVDFMNHNKPKKVKSYLREVDFHVLDQIIKIICTLLGVSQFFLCESFVSSSGKNTNCVYLCILM